MHANVESQLGAIHCRREEEEKKNDIKAAENMNIFSRRITDWQGRRQYLE